MIAAKGTYKVLRSPWVIKRKVPITANPTVIDCSNEGSFRFFKATYAMIKTGEVNCKIVAVAALLYLIVMK